MCIRDRQDVPLLLDEIERLRQHSICENVDAQSDLLEIWKVLEVLTVSLDRLGEFELIHGEGPAKEALHRFMGPGQCSKIAHTRKLMTELLINCDPALDKLTEELAENEVAMGYWDGQSG